MTELPVVDLLSEPVTAPSQAPPSPKPMDSLTPEAPARAPDGKFAKKESDDDALRRIMAKHGIEAEQDHSEGKPAEEPTPAKSEPSPAAKAARKALELDGWDEGDLSGLSDERLVALGEKAKKRQADVANKLRAAKDAARSDGEAPAKSKGSEPVLAEPAQPIDLDSALKPVIDELALSKESGSALAKVLKGLVEPLHAELREAKRQLSAVNERTAEAEVTAARKELGERFPDLSDDGEFESVVQEALHLAPGLRAAGRANTVREIVEVVCRLRYPGAKPASKSSDPKLRDLGQPITASKPLSKAALTRDQIDDAVLRHLEKNPGDVAGARKIAQGR